MDGIKKSLQHRKFCVDCSPYKSHNTSPYDPRWRGLGKRKRPKAVLSKEKTEEYVVGMYFRGLDRKSKLVNMKGGKCEHCGYNKYQRVLTFHHLDPKIKKFNLCLNFMWSKKWEDLVEEVAKCKLLCFNCHMEEEAKIKADIVKRVNEKYGTNF